jgi:hypothetical protein
MARCHPRTGCCRVRSWADIGSSCLAGLAGPMGMSDTAFFVTPDRKARFTEVYHWDGEQNKLVLNPARTDRGGFEDPARLER